MVYGIKQVGKEYDKWEIIDVVLAEEGVFFNEIEKFLIKVLCNFLDLQEIIELGNCWEGGKFILELGDLVKVKEMFIESFFYKIVMVCDCLCVME